MNSKSAQNARMLDDSRKHYTRLVRKIVHQIQEERECRFTGLSSTIIANAILGICNWSIRWYKKDGPMSLEEICQQLYELIEPGC